MGSAILFLMLQSIAVFAHTHYEQIFNNCKISYRIGAIHTIRGNLKDTGNLWNIAKVVSGETTTFWSFGYDNST